MARDYGRIRVTVWQDEDFTALTVKAQQLYFYLVTQAKIDMAGVVPWRPRMAVRTASDLTVQDVENAMAELESRRFILLDEDTDEALVRSFIRNDEVLRSPNMAKALVKAWRGIDSKILRQVVAFEVIRLRNSDPSLKGMENCGAILAHSALDPSQNPFGKGSEKDSRGTVQGEPLQEGMPNNHNHNHILNNHNQDSAQSVASSIDAKRNASSDAHNRDERFAKFWSEYPIKRDKKKAYKPFLKALDRTSLDQLIDGARQYAQDPNRDDKFTKYAEGWLNGDCWNDGPLPVRTAGSGSRTAVDKMQDTLAIAQQMEHDYYEGGLGIEAYGN